MDKPQWVWTPIIFFRARFKTPMSFYWTDLKIRKKALTCFTTFCLSSSFHLFCFVLETKGMLVNVHQYFSLQLPGWEGILRYVQVVATIIMIMIQLVITNGHEFYITPKQCLDQESDGIVSPKELVKIIKVT